MITFRPRAVAAAALVLTLAACCGTDVLDDHPEGLVWSSPPRSLTVTNASGGPFELVGHDGAPDVPLADGASFAFPLVAEVREIRPPGGEPYEERSVRTEEGRSYLGRQGNDRLLRVRLPGGDEHDLLVDTCADWFDREGQPAPEGLEAVVDDPLLVGIPVNVCDL